MFNNAKDRQIPKKTKEEVTVAVVNFQGNNDVNLVVEIAAPHYKIYY